MIVFNTADKNKNLKNGTSTMRRDPIPTDRSDRYDEESALQRAISEALTGYAKDGGTWEQGKWVFQDALLNGERADDALYSALVVTRDGAESTPEEAAKRFWKTLPIDNAIGNALTGYAKDGGTWEQGKWVFKDSLERSIPIADALDGALVAARDGAQSTDDAATTRFWETLQPSYKEKEPVVDIEDGVVLSELIHKPKWKGEFAGTYKGTKDGRPVIVKHGLKDDLGRERTILSAINYKGIPKVTSYNEDEEKLGGLTRMSMELLPGRSFDKFLGMDKQWNSERINTDSAAAIAIELTRCFEAVSAGGYLYRDLSPAHIMIDNKNGKYSVGLVDVEASARKGRDGKAKILDQRGTWETMSPEEFEDNATISEASNVYSIGCVLLQMIRGKSPFRASSEETDNFDEQRALCKKRHQTIQPQIHGRLSKVVGTALNPDARKRYQTLRDFRKAIAEAL